MTTEEVKKEKKKNNSFLILIILQPKKETSSIGRTSQLISDDLLNEEFAEIDNFMSEFLTENNTEQTNDRSSKVVGYDMVWFACIAFEIFLSFQFFFFHL